MNIDVYPYSIALRHRFRGLTSRDGVLLHGPGGWAEASPFWDYGIEYSARWLLGALAQASGWIPTLPGHLYRTQIVCNATIPAVEASIAYSLAQQSGAHTVKVKVADRCESVAADCERLEAVRSAVGPGGKIRIDINGRWDVEKAERVLPVLDKAAGGLEYAEQPVMDTSDLALLHRKIQVPLAADESIRRSADPLRVARLHAADVAVIKVQPLGGIQRALTMVDALGLPCTISSALETSVGLYQSFVCAAMLRKLPYACGLGTLSLFNGDVARESYLPRAGVVALRSVIPDCLDRVAAPEPCALRWSRRFAGMWDYLASLGSAVWENSDSAHDAHLFVRSSTNGGWSGAGGRLQRIQGGVQVHTGSSRALHLPNGEKLVYTFHVRNVESDWHNSNARLVP